MPDEIHIVDRHVGARLRELRKLRRMSQTRLGVALGITFQQVQKYENGTNRISASKLFDMAHALSVPVAYFFDGLPVDEPMPPPLSSSLEGAALEIGQLCAGLTPSRQKIVRTLVRTLGAVQAERRGAQASSL